MDSWESQAYSYIKLLGSTLVTCFLTFLIFLNSAYPCQAALSERGFLKLELEFLHEYQLPKQQFADTSVGGLSAIAYDRDRDRFYALSDDRSDKAPARFYTLKLDIDEGTPNKSDKPKLDRIEVEKVTFLRNPQGEFYAKGEIDPEGMAITFKSVYISSEGVTRAGIPAFIDEFDLETGKWLQSLPIPSRYLPAATGEAPKGIEDNLGFEALTLVQDIPGDPFRIFAATESALAQDKDSDVTKEQNNGAKSRMLHYLVGVGPAQVVSEYLYPLEPSPTPGVNGLTELLVIDRGGHFLSLERSFNGLKFGVKIFQITTGSANDISGIPSLRDNPGKVKPIRKQLLLDLNDLGIRLDNLEGMALGKPLADGSQSLVLISDDNFQNAQVNQFLLLRLKQKR
jgi:hypothetical protein